MAAEDGGGCIKTTSRFGLLCLGRCTVALVVSALAAVILIRAVFLILHPNKFQLKVSGNVLVQRVNINPDKFVCTFYLRADNRRERAFMYYRNVTVRLIDNGHPPPDKVAPSTIMELNLEAAITLLQGEGQDYYLSVLYAKRLNDHYLQALFSGEELSIGDCTVELDGMLTQDTEGTISGDSYRASYSCAPVTIANAPNVRNGKFPLSTDPHHAAQCVPTVF